ncbi:MAG: putative 2OG-Fe(II) oxygenase [Rhizomicrobium sp.]
MAAPGQITALLERAIAAGPERAEPYAKLGAIHLDSYRPIEALVAFEAAAQLEPGRPEWQLRLAQLRNIRGLPSEALEALAEPALRAVPFGAEVDYQRGLALLALGDRQDAETALRAALARDPGHRRACLNLCRLLRDAGRMDALLAVCESLVAQGVTHAQLMLDWGRALAIAGEDAKAKRLLFDPARVTRQSLAMPDGFNEALATELLANPYAICDFPEEEANRGSSRVHHLLNGARPDLVRTLSAAIRSAVEARIAATAPSTGNDFDPWAAARPQGAHLHAWGLIQRGGDHEAWHTHRGGWLSGVYYVRVPQAVARDTDGRGALEFGPPPYLARTQPGLIETRRYVPREGMLLLAPSHYHHRTIASGLDEYRISFAFDVVPDDNR